MIYLYIYIPYLYFVLHRLQLKLLVLGTRFVCLSTEDHQTDFFPSPDKIKPQLRSSVLLASIFFQMFARARYLFFDIIQVRPHYNESQIVDHLGKSGSRQWTDGQ